jgi:2-keto-3-deoxy-L-fuconate dehydrogenase
MGPDGTALFVEEGSEVFADARDLTQPNAAGDLIQEAGHVDVLIANLAFSYYRGGVLELSDSEMERTFCRLVYPLHRLIRAVLPQMLARRHGKIVVVGSASALRERAGISLYAAARGAQHGLCLQCCRGVRAPRPNQLSRPDLC